MTFVSARSNSWLVTALAILLTAVMACSSRPDAVVGKWRPSADANAALWEFSKDGLLLIGSLRGRYSFGDRQRIKIETPFATSVYQMEWSDEQLILTEPNGSKLRFTRVR